MFSLSVSCYLPCILVSLRLNGTLWMSLCFSVSVQDKYNIWNFSLTITTWLKTSTSKGWFLSHLRFYLVRCFISIQIWGPQFTICLRLICGLMILLMVNLLKNMLCLWRGYIWLITECNLNKRIIKEKRRITKTLISLMNQQLKIMILMISNRQWLKTPVSPSNELVKLIIK